VLEGACFEADRAMRCALVLDLLRCIASGPGDVRAELERLVGLGPGSPAYGVSYRGSERARYLAPRLTETPVILMLIYRDDEGSPRSRTPWPISRGSVSR
jgi:hypothetical protein